MLNVSRSTLWRWIREHGLKVIRVGGVARIRESDLERFLSRHTGNIATPNMTALNENNIDPNSS